MKKLHLICNAHIDPIWLWEADEGASAAISTFRSAVRLSNEFDYIFCHNEAILYQWIKEYEPILFAQIIQLVKEKKWHIMGGWFLQPDCNMPSGESFVRQIQVGRKFFRENFQTELPSTAINFDPFGHTIGLVQILSKCGYTDYIVTRPHAIELCLPDEIFLWKGLDDSLIKCVRVDIGYNSFLGEASKKIEQIIAEQSIRDVWIALWGVGNHGGGPSRKDLNDISVLIENSEVDIVHSTPDLFFKDLTSEAPVVEISLTDVMPGCYSSMVQVKQRHIKLENELYMTEKMTANAAANGLLEYPHNKFNEAVRSLLISEFHDVVTGTCIREGEESSIRLLDYGLHIVNSIRTKTLFALINGQTEAAEGEYPIFIYNHFPYDIKTIIECEFQLCDQNWDEDFTTVIVYDKDRIIPSQVIKESSNLSLDWRKRVIFECELKAGELNRFSCYAKRLPSWPSVPEMDIKDNFIFDNGEIKATINLKTGLLDSYIVGGTEYISGNAFCPVVCSDNEDPWANNKDQLVTLHHEIDRFKLMNSKESSEFSGIFDRELPAVRIIEDGDVICVVEALFYYHNSFLRIEYRLYKKFNDIDISVDLFWNEKNKLLKLCIPTTVKGDFIGQTAFGQNVLPQNGKEAVAQKWVAIKNEQQTVALINNCSYAFSSRENEIAVTLIRGVAYSALPIYDRDITSRNRFTSRMDQGERNFHYKLTAGKTETVCNCMDFKAQLFNEKPYAFNAFPSGEGEIPQRCLKISNQSIILVAFKQSEDGRYIARLHNNSQNSCETELVSDKFGINTTLQFGKFEVKTIRMWNENWEECTSMEI